MTAHSEAAASIECRVDGDPRLIAGAAMIVAHVARRAGLATGPASDLAAAVAQMSLTALESEKEISSRTVRLSASEISNRIEVSVELLGGSSASHLSSEQSGDLADRLRQISKPAVDDVNLEIREGLPRITILKNCGARHPFAV